MSEKHSVTVHGYTLSTGDYYFGQCPEVEGIWARCAVKPSNGLIQDLYCASTGKGFFKNTRFERGLSWWTYLGPVPPLGECKCALEPFVVRAKYKRGSFCYTFMGEFNGRNWFVDDISNEAVEFDHNNGLVRVEPGKEDEDQAGVEDSQKPTNVSANDSPDGKSSCSKAP